ncbi:hypothetical protein Back2_21030 [Nocardioides baekrokdamisoli]|uniref:Uncharacterized protein n=1 Tax=Nocardioides baekrokdamisoli TaxID=1804624 RepID=A0A3G9IHK5_9ACTN|nr:hypothetical protein [Nocardioides baekrokdamisoli]BBH17816.1 hypothetical protein Back2_21030 [Nocardioides baekrokdamisoli]
MSSLLTLAERLKVPAADLAMLKTYDEAQIAQIDGVIGDAFEAEDQAFGRAVEESLTFLPRLIRPIAKKLMLGG